MFQGTTPSLPFKIPGVDLTTATVFVTIKDSQRKNEITKSGSELIVTYNDEAEDGPYSLVLCPLTQEETLKLHSGEAVCQIRFIDNQDQAYATVKATVNVSDVLYKGVIAHE